MFGLLTYVKAEVHLFWHALCVLLRTWLYCDYIAASSFVLIIWGLPALLAFRMCRCKCPPHRVRALIFWYLVLWEVLSISDSPNWSELVSSRQFWEPFSSENRMNLLEYFVRLVQNVLYLFYVLYLCLDHLYWKQIVTIGKVQKGANKIAFLNINNGAHQIFLNPLSKNQIIVLKTMHSTIWKNKLNIIGYGMRWDVSHRFVIIRCINGHIDHLEV